MVRRWGNRLAALAAAAVVATAGVGCTYLMPATQPIEAPVSALQGAAYAYAQIGALYGLVGDLAQRRRITRAEGEAALRQIGDARKALDVAVESRHPAGIKTATDALIAIEAALKARASS
ncbi:MAG: hypothetical protein KA761_00265 [Gemmatimonadaceae bacterium]|nr:hypothetical protein [Gemmatimonadaceae bacterium]